MLRLAERGLYRPLWSPDIIEELHRNLVEVGISVRVVDNFVAEMDGAFPDAEVTGYGTLTCPP